MFLLSRGMLHGITSWCSGTTLIYLSFSSQFLLYACRILS